jgi:hypothetical protein
MRVAERRDGRQLPPSRNCVTHADPRVRPAHVVRVFARREQLAEDLLHRRDVVDLVAGNRGERFIEHRHAIVGAITVHQAGAEIGERGELQIGIAATARHLDRLVEQRFLTAPVRLEHAGVQRHPAALGGIVSGRQKRAGRDTATRS